MSFEIRNPAAGEFSEQFDLETDSQPAPRLITDKRRCSTESKLTWDIFQHQERRLSECGSKSSLDVLQNNEHSSVIGENGSS